jgi:hypothetical protein
MKNKNTVKATTVINNIRRMISQPAMQGPKHQAWRESWLHVIKGLERGESI